LCRQQAEVIQNHENVNVRNIGKGEAWQQSSVWPFKWLGSHCNMSYVS
jgi:hypothetical protein